MDDLITMMYEQTILIAERPSEFDLLIGERVYGKHGNYWELLVNEQLEKCNNAMRFNPCQEFKDKVRLDYENSASYMDDEVSGDDIDEDNEEDEDD